jgi:hypothetical protein
VEDTPRAWVLLTLGEDRQYGGNLGYVDDVSSAYRYDSFVPNHRQVRAGDVAILRDRLSILGSATIESIEAGASEKTRLSCPDCDTTAIKERHTIAPRYRCRRGHEFEEPRQQSVSCTSYAALFQGTFIPARDVVPVGSLRPAELQSSDQLSIRAIDLSRVPDAIKEIVGLPRTRRGAYAAAVDLIAVRGSGPSEDPEYEVTTLDARALVLRSIRARQGQARFRAMLRDRYGDACMITGCAVMDVVEAAHISPYRGTADNHADNGLLLRADLHTLFDLDLLAIDPSSLRVQVHPEIVGPEYANINGRLLQIGNRGRPSQPALEERWARFVAGVPRRAARTTKPGVPSA